jgi:tetratricopeptide (TPR) repeat protein
MHSFSGSRRFAEIVGVIAPLFLLASVILAQSDYDQRFKSEDIRAPIHRFAMPANVVRHLAFGFNDALADLYWITAIQAYVKWDGKDVFYPEYYRIISALDPRFEYPYDFAILTVPNKKNPDSLAWLKEIADRGAVAFPNDYQIPFYAGAQFHQIAHSYQEALEYVSRAAKIPSAPPAVKQVYATYLLKTASDYERSHAFFNAIYETATNDETRRIAKKQMDTLDLIEELEQAAVKYRSVYGIYPETLGALSDGGIVKVPKAVLEKLPLTIDPKSGHVVAH